MKKTTYAKRVELLGESTTIAISTLARELKAAGQDILSFSAGEPDFDTPEEITNEAIQALKDHKTKYGPTLGNLDLRKKIAEFEKKQNHFSCDADEIIITHGSTEALTSCLFTMINPKDEIIIPMPAYPMYRQMIEFMGGVVVPIDTTKHHFQSFADTSDMRALEL